MFDVCLFFYIDDVQTRCRPIQIFEWILFNHSRGFFLPLLFVVVGVFFFKENVINVFQKHIRL